MSGLNVVDDRVKGIVSDFEALVSKCKADLSRALESSKAYDINFALKNFRESLVAQAEFLQSVGLLPKVADKSEKVVRADFGSVDLSEDDKSVLNRAAGILDKQRKRKVESEGLH